MRAYIKICGLTRPEDVQTALLYGADMLGFIVEAKSVRRLSVQEAAQIARPAFGCAKRVAVTVNADEDLIGRICVHMRPDYIQFHGDETPAYIKQIKERYNVGTIKALAIRDRDDLGHAKTFEDRADYILLDAKTPQGEIQRGGHGLSFDWALLKGFTCVAPLILAGGLNPDNIHTAKATGFDYFDVSSGVERMPGVKDPSRIQAFMKAARS